jgi:ubiquinone/menaquinone biosynthesis C-methylase UbiE
MTLRERVVARWRRRYPAEVVGTTNLSNREAWLEKAIAAIPKGKKILDAGAGELQYKRFCEHLEYVSQDFGQYDGQGNDVGLQTKSWDNSKLDIVSDITEIPVPDRSFDAIMCIEVFEHIPRPIEALEEFSRILRPGGTLVVTTPVSSITHFAPYYFYNGYTRYFFEKLLDETGFKVREINFNGNYFDHIAQELRRIEEVASKYTQDTPELEMVDEMAYQKLLNRLERLSAGDTGSAELLSFGIQVVAERTKGATKKART